jgi:superfamily II DNA helicase RecQ
MATQIHVFHLERDFSSGMLDDGGLRESLHDHQVTAWRGYPASNGAGLWLVVESEALPAEPTEPHPTAPNLAERLGTPDRLLFDALRVWRAARAKGLEWPAYRVVTNAALAGIATIRPTRTEDLEGLPGIGPLTMERFGAEILDLVGSHEPSAVQRQGTGG